MITVWFHALVLMLSKKPIIIIIIIRDDQVGYTWVT